jgi:hypothetical protein
LPRSADALTRFISSSALGTAILCLPSVIRLLYRQKELSSFFRTKFLR